VLFTEYIRSFKWASEPQTLVTLQSQPGGETTKSIRDMWGKNVLLMNDYVVHIDMS
jgi:hypothetical protein